MVLARIPFISIMQVTVTSLARPLRARWVTIRSFLRQFLLALTSALLSTETKVMTPLPFQMAPMLRLVPILTIQGGAGADLLTNSGVASAGTGVFSYAKYSDSTLDSMDTIGFNTAAISAGVGGFQSSRIRVAVSTGSLSLATGAGAVGTVSAASGYIVFSGFSDSSLTSRVSAVDAGYTTTGQAAIFTTDNTNRFLFVQGGATDIVVKLADENSLSAGLAEINLSGNVMGFGD